MFIGRMFFYAYFFFALCFVFCFLLIYFSTLLLYKHKPHYVNLAFHIGVSLPFYLFVLFLPDNVRDRLFVFDEVLFPFLISLVPHLAFTLYAIFYARKTDKQKLAFRKNLIRYIVSFFIGTIFTIASFFIVFVIGHCILKQDFYVKEIYSIIPYILIVMLGINTLFFSKIVYGNHKPFFTKLFHRIRDVIRKKK